MITFGTTCPAGPDRLDAPAPGQDRKPLSDRRIHIALLFALILAAQLFLPAMASARQQADLLPDNATRSAYGGSWTCDLGFFRNEGACEPIALPENAYLSSRSYDRGWLCKHGYIPNDGRCVPDARDG